MAIILDRNDYEYSNEIIYKDKDTQEIIFRLDVNLTSQEVEKVRDAFDPDKPQLKDETLYWILFKDNYADMVDKVGMLKTEEFAIRLATDIVGKLSMDRIKGMNSVAMKYQKKLNKLQK